MKRLFAIVIALLCLSAILVGAPVGAANPNVGYPDFAFGSTPGTDVTADKPQSKLWYTDDNIWWSVMFHQASGTWHIYRLNWPNTWQDTGTVVDDRATSRADALWDNGKLYIASLVRFSSSNQGRLYRYSYNASNKTYSLDGGFPTQIMSGSAETMAFDRDSTGRLWITFTQNKQVYVNHSTTADNVWSTPFIVPGAAAIGSDDISSLVAYTDNNGPSIGVLWSSHSSASSPAAMNFAYHIDSNAPGSWQPVETIYGGTGSCLADDHINLKSLQADSSGRIFAALKTSLGDSGCPSGNEAIRLVVRNPNNTWKWTTFGTTSESHTRPVVLLDTSSRKVYMFATSPTSCGIIYYKTTPMDNPSFASGKGDPFISSSTNTCINNATTTKQTVNAASGLVVMASDESSKVYLHNAISLGGTTPTPTTPTSTPVTPTPTTPTSTPVTTTPTSTPVTPTPTTPPSGGASIKNITFENGSLTDATTGADAVVGTVTLESSTPLDGSYAATINSSSGYLREDFTGVNELYASFYLRLNATPTTSSRIVLISNGSTSVGNIYLTTSRTLQLRNGSTTIGTSAALTVGTLYKVGLHQKAGSGNAVVEAFVTPVGSAFGSPFASSSAQSFTSQATRFSLGATNSSATNITVDDIALDATGFGGGSTPADTTPPTVTAVSPSNNATDVSLSAAVTATFSEAVSGVSASSFYMTGPNGTVAANVSYNSANKTATLQPSALLSPGVAYYVFLTGDIKDAANNALAPVQWSFTTTAPVNDTTAPTITNVSPAANASNVSVGTSVKVTFSEPVVNVSTSTFTLSPGGPSIAATVSYDNATNTATLVPSAALQPNTLYTATVWSQITDIAGNPINSYSWLFTTASAPVDSTPPTVTSKSPAANASNVSRNLIVSVAFSEAVTGVGASTFTLSGPNGQVAAGVAYLPDNTATLTPSVTLDANTTYTINLTSGIADTAGNPLAATSWSFTTAGATSATQIKAMTFENGSLTNATTGADSVVGTVALETANPLKGAFSATINNSSGYLREDFTAVDEIYTSFYLRVNALGSNARLALITNGSASAGNIYLTSTGALQLRNGSTVIGVNSAALTPGTLYRVGLHQKKGTGGNAVVEAYVAVGDAAFGSPFASSAAQTFTTQATRFSLGATNSAAMNVTVDSVVLDTAGF